MIPLFWWPISQRVVQDIVFLRFMVITIFNPSHLFSRLEEIGYTIKPHGSGKYEVRKEHKGKQIGLGEASYYLSMIQEYLFDEESIVNLIQKIEVTTINSAINKCTKAELVIHQHFGES